MKIVNNTGIDLKELENKISEFYPYSKKTLGFDRDPSSINLVSDPENASNILGKTAFYDPSSSSITVYTDNRHPKDILRSISHELVHHTQNCRGEFSEIQELDQNYAQNNKKLREMEQEAYLMGNMTFRDWEDGIKSNTNEEITMKSEYNKKKIKENKLTTEEQNLKELEEVSWQGVKDKVRGAVGMLPSARNAYKSPSGHVIWNHDRAEKGFFPWQLAKQNKKGMWVMIPNKKNDRGIHESPFMTQQEAVRLEDLGADGLSRLAGKIQVPWFKGQKAPMDWIKLVAKNPQAGFDGVYFLKGKQDFEGADKMMANLRQLQNADLEAQWAQGRKDAAKLKSQKKFNGSPGAYTGGPSAPKNVAIRGSNDTQSHGFDAGDTAKWNENLTSRKAKIMSKRNKLTTEEQNLKEVRRLKKELNNSKVMNEYNKKKIKEMMNTIITRVKQELAEAEKPDFLDVDKDGDKEEPMSKATDEKKYDGEEKSDKDMSKVPPQLRKHVAKKMDESESVEESSCGGDHKREDDELDEGCCGKCGQSDCGCGNKMYEGGCGECGKPDCGSCGNKMYEEDEGMEGFLSERRNNLFGKLVNEWFSAEKK